MESNASTTLTACVLQVRPDSLLVRDCHTCQDVMVHTAQACSFARGDLVCIRFSGAMTRSIPPQITALDITRTDGCR